MGKVLSLARCCLPVVFSCDSLQRAVEECRSRKMKFYRRPRRSISLSLSIIRDTLLLTSPFFQRAHLRRCSVRVPPPFLPPFRTFLLRQQLSFSRPLNSGERDRGREGGGGVKGDRIVDPRIVDPRIVDPRMVDPKES